MAALTICSDFGAPQNKVWHCFHCFLIYLPWSDGTECHDLSFLNVPPWCYTYVFTLLCVWKWAELECTDWVWGRSLPLTGCVTWMGPFPSLCLPLGFIFLRQPEGALLPPGVCRAVTGSWFEAVKQGAPGGTPRGACIPHPSRPPVQTEPPIGSPFWPNSQRCQVHLLTPPNLVFPEHSHSSWSPTACIHIPVVVGNLQQVHLSEPQFPHL